MKKNLLFFFTLLFFYACSDDENLTPELQQKSETYPVHLILNTDFSQLDGILSISNTTKIVSEPRVITDTLGYKGILLYSNADRELSAFDIACPYCWNGNILTKTGDPDNSFECKVCGFYTFLNSGGGSFPNHQNHDPLYVYLVKYKVTKIDKRIYLVTNPSR